MLLACGLVPVSFGVVLLPSKLDIAVPCLAFFGTCTVMAISTIVRKRRFVRLRPISVEIVGGTPIRPSRSSLATLATTLLGLGVVLFVYLRSGPMMVVVSIGVMLVTGALLALGLLTGLLPAGYMQFDPSGLTIGGRRGAFTLPWDAIARVSPGEFNDNPVLLLWVRDMSSVVVRPPGARNRVIAGLESNIAWVGAHVMIMSSLYEVDLPLLASAVEKYVASPSARRQLAVPRLPAAGTEA